MTLFNAIYKKKLYNFTNIYCLIYSIETNYI